MTLKSDVLADRPITPILRTHGVTAEQTGTREVTFSVTADDLFKLVTKLQDGELPMHYSNKHNVVSTLNEGDSEWSGGSSEQFFKAADGIVDTTGFLLARKQFGNQINNVDFLQELTSRKRARVMSEYDGEFDFDRMYERKPFYATKIVNNGNTRVVDIYCSFNFSSNIDANYINKYAAYCWAIVDSLESSGVQCNIFISTYTLTPYGSHPERGNVPLIQDLEYWTTLIKVKSSEEYMDTLELARCFSTCFYRRGVFAFWALVFDGIDWMVPNNFGAPNKDKDKFRVEKGRIHLTPSAYSGTPDIKDFQDLIKKAL